MKNLFNPEEVNTLIHILQTKGVRYLLGTEQPANEDVANISPVELIQRLAACDFPLVEHASIALFILHPEFAPAVLAALQESEPETAENIAVVTLATLYMQQWWLFRLTIALGHLPAFPEAPFTFLWEERHLPPPSEGYGRDGFLALQEYQQQKFGLPINFRHDWQNQIDHLLAQEEAYQRQIPDDAKNALLKNLA